MKTLVKICSVIGAFYLVAACGNVTQSPQQTTKGKPSDCTKSQCFANATRKCYNKGYYFISEPKQTAWVCEGNNKWRELKKA